MKRAIVITGSSACAMAVRDGPASIADSMIFNTQLPRRETLLNCLAPFARVLLPSQAHS